MIRRGGSFQPFSELDAADRAWIGGFIAEDPIQPLFLATAIEDLARGIDNRFILIDRQRRGLAFGIAFDGIEVFTVTGLLDDDACKALAARPRGGEIHVKPAMAARLADVFGSRLRSRESMLVYGRPLDRMPAADPDCRRLSRQDAAALTAFYAAHYPETAFSDWMLDHPFMGYVEDDRILAAAGTMTASMDRRWSLIGNFLTHPAARGRGLARRVGAALIAALYESGIRRLSLTTTDGNAAARRVYEGLGFTVQDCWILLDVDPTTN